MKNLLILAFSAIMLLSCNGSDGLYVYKNATSGVNIKGVGLKSDLPYYTIDGEKVKRNTFFYGEKIFINFNNFKGFKNENGLAKPGLFMAIVNEKSKDTILVSKDLLADIGNGTALKPLLLNANFTAAYPYLNDESYHIHILIWDKKGSGTFDFTMPFKIEANENLLIRSLDVNYKAIYLWDQEEKKAITNNKMKITDKLYIIYEGLNGFKVENDKVYPAYQIEMVDASGNVLLKNDNLLNEVTNSGMSITDFHSQIPIIISFQPGKIVNPVTLTTKLYDSKSNKHLQVNTQLQVYGN